MKEYEEVTLTTTTTAVFTIPKDANNSDKTSWYKGDWEVSFLRIDNPQEVSANVSLRGTMKDGDEEMEEAGYENSVTRDITVRSKSQEHIKTSYPWEFLDLEFELNSTTTYSYTITFAIQNSKRRR